MTLDRRAVLAGAAVALTTGDVARAQSVQAPVVETASAGCSSAMRHTTLLVPMSSTDIVALRRAESGFRRGVRQWGVCIGRYFARTRRGTVRRAVRGDALMSASPSSASCGSRRGRRPPPR